MTPRSLLTEIVDPALARLAQITGVQSDGRARLMVMAIAGQESGWKERRQIGGPARSFWQFERGGGVAGLFRVTSRKLEAVCNELHIPYDRNDVFEAMAWNDTLAACMARLLLWTDPAPLPDIGNVDAGWAYYLRNWRPGLPHPELWPERYATAMGLLSPAKETT